MVGDVGGQRRTTRVDYPWAGTGTGGHYYSSQAIKGAHVTMAGLQRSSGTFRRSGSSGMVWDDDRRLSGEIRPSPGRREAGEDGPPARVQRSRSTGHGGYRAGAGRVSPALDPPSPRIGACSFCGFFGAKAAGKKNDGGKDKSKITPRAAANHSPRRRRASG